MKMLSLILLAMTLSSAAFANAGLNKAIKNLKNKDVRTVARLVTEADATPCSEAGGHIVDLQVKTAAYNYETQKVVHTWETVKSISVSKNGSVMEVCAE